MLKAVLFLCVLVGSVYPAAATPKCENDDFQCVTSGKCISEHLTCNCKKDCEDGSDEDVSHCGYDVSPINATCGKCSMNGLGEIQTKTFDGQKVLYKGSLTCEILLLESVQNCKDKKGFRVVALTSLDSGAKYISGIIIYIYQLSGEITKVVLMEKGNIYVNGMLQSLDNLSEDTFEAHNMTINHIDSIKVSMVRIAEAIFYYRSKGGVGSHHVVLLILDECYKTNLQGFCGNYNGDIKDDLYARSGKVTIGSEAVVNSWILGECPSVDAINREKENEARKQEEDEVRKHED